VPATIGDMLRTVTDGEFPSPRPLTMSQSELEERNESQAIGDAEMALARPVSRLYPNVSCSSLDEREFTPIKARAVVP
jgi:hypothetical protein